MMTTHRPRATVERDAPVQDDELEPVRGAWFVLLGVVLAVAAVVGGPQKFLPSSGGHPLDRWWLSATEPWRTACDPAVLTCQEAVPADAAWLVGGLFLVGGLTLGAVQAARRHRWGRLPPLT